MSMYSIDFKEMARIKADHDTKNCAVKRNKIETTMYREKRHNNNSEDADG